MKLKTFNATRDLSIMSVLIKSLPEEQTDSLTPLIQQAFVEGDRKWHEINRALYGEKVDSALQDFLEKTNIEAHLTSRSPS